MTYRWYRSMVCLAHGMRSYRLTVRVERSREAAPPSAGNALHKNDFGADAAVGVDFEQQRMPQPAVDHVRLADAGRRLSRQASTLGIMPSSMTPRAIRSRQPAASRLAEQRGGSSRGRAGCRACR